jgi:hypothetical protein
MRAVGVWVILIAVEFVHGVLRAVFLVPVVGDSRARQIGVFTGSVLILCVAYLLVGWLRAENTKSLIIVGALWLVVTVVFEFGFGHFVFGRSWQDLGSDYNIAHGGFLAIGMLVLAFSPVIGARLRR